MTLAENSAMKTHRFHSPSTPWALAACASVVLLAACQGSPEAADMVLTGGKVVTMAAGQPEAEAIAVSGYRILAVGSEDEIQEYIGPDTEVIDLQGGLAIPGFIEGHGHWMGLGNAQMILDLTVAKNWNDIVAMVAEAAAQAEPGEWITGRGWHQEKWNEVPTPNVDGVPLHAGLSRVSPNNPVNLTHASGHASFANSAALEAAGIGADTADPPGGTILRDASGDPTGLLRETAQRLVGAAISRSEESMTAEELRARALRQVELAGQDALSKGVTSFHDAGSSFATIDFLRELDEADELPVRLYVMVRRESNEAMEEKLEDYRIIADGNGHLTVRAIKRQIDGALGSHGAWLLEPYVDLQRGEGDAGLVLEAIDDITRTAEIALEHGFQLNTHAIGARANREVLDIYEKVFATAPDATDLRWRIEHAQHIHPDDVPRFAELGVIAAMQGIHATSDGPWIDQRLGEERARVQSYLWRTLIDSGVTITNGTDVPVEDIAPLVSYYATVSRMMRTGERLTPEQRMTRMEALASYTINGAYAAFEEDIKGSLEPGKLADITVLSRDILTIPEAEILDTDVLYTIVGGEVRFRR